MSYFVVADGVGFLDGSPVEGPFDTEEHARARAGEKIQASFKRFDAFLEKSFNQGFFDVCDLERAYFRLRKRPDPSIPRPVTYLVLTEKDLLTEGLP